MKLSIKILILISFCLIWAFTAVYFPYIYFVLTIILSLFLILFFRKIVGLLFLFSNIFMVVFCKQGIWFNFYINIDDFQEIANIKASNCVEPSIITENDITNTCLSEQKIQKVKFFLAKHKIKHITIDKKSIDIVYSFDTIKFKSVAITNRKPISGIFKIKSIQLAGNWYYYEIN